MGWRSIFAGELGATGLGIPSAGVQSSPGTGGGQNAGQLEPNSRAANMAAGVPYKLVPVYPPFVRIADDPNIVYAFRSRSLIFGGNGVAAATTTQQFQFSLPTIIIARTGSAFLANDVGMPVGRTSLQLARVQMFRAGSQSDLIDAGGGGVNNPAVTVLAECLLGTAGLPALIPGNGLFVDTGSFLNVTAQLLINSTELHFCIWALEEYGPARG